ncbi:MAG TPA: hypothetical protein VKM55_21305 [Candidatus Lokiarchaeia archaeon]|nr:hypothetical protein [Candidatus Lokiarchaeia archaeon]
MSQKGSKKQQNQSVDSLESLLASKDQSEQLQKKIDMLSNELSETRSKLETTTTQLNDLTTEHEELKTSSEKECELKESLTAQFNDLNEELKDLKKNVSAKDEAMATKDNQLMDKDEIIKSKDEELQNLSAQFAELQAQVNDSQSTQSDKVAELQEQLMTLQKEKEMAKLAEANAKAKLQELTTNYDKLKVKMRDTGDSVLGATMQAEKLQAEINEKDAEIVALNEKLGSNSGSGAMLEKDKLAEIMMATLQRTQRSIRICLPSLSLVESLGLLPVIQGFPRTTVVNIAADIKATDEHIVMDLKKRGVTFTQYDHKDRWIMNRDGEDMVVALEMTDGEVIGFYSNEPRVITMLNTVIMEPWVKGMKI